MMTQAGFHLPPGIGQISDSHSVSLKPGDIIVSDQGWKPRSFSTDPFRGGPDFHPESPKHAFCTGWNSISTEFWVEGGFGGKSGAAPIPPYTKTHKFSLFRYFQDFLFHASAGNRRVESITEVPPCQVGPDSGYRRRRKKDKKEHDE